MKNIKLSFSQRWYNFIDRNEMHKPNWLENESIGKTPEEIKKLEEFEEDYFFRTGKSL